MFWRPAILSFAVWVGAQLILASDLAGVSAPAIALSGMHSAPKTESALLNVNIGAIDRRRSISEYPEVFSAQIISVLRRISGIVVCDGREAEARLIENGRQIVANAHLFLGKDEQPSMPSRCHFATKANPKRKISVDLTPGHFFLGTQRPSADRRNDYVLARLAESIGDVTLPRFGAIPAVGETIYLVNHDDQEAKRSFDPDQLIAQDCTVRTSRPGDEAELGFFTSDCSAMNGASGSIYYALRNGQLEAVGLHKMSGYAAANGRPYDIAHPDPEMRSFALGLSFDEKLLKNSRELAKVGAPDFTSKASPTQSSMTGIKLRDLSPDDQILYGIPDVVKGVLVSSSSREGFVEGDVIMGETLERISRLHAEGILSMTVSVRKLGGQTERRALSLE